MITNVKGLDGKKDHSIGNYKELIFDSNVEYLLHLSLDALSLCCSDGKKKCDFVRFHLTYQFTHFDKYKTIYNSGEKMQI